MKKPRTLAPGPVPNAAVACAHTRVVALSTLTPHPRNPNGHPTEQLRLLGKVIRANGWRSPIVVSKRSGLIIKGHGRLAAALLAGFTHGPIDEQDYADEAAEMADLVADNRLSELSEIDERALASLLAEMNTGDIDMEVLGFTTKSLADLTTRLHVETQTDADPKMDQAAALAKSWGVKRGQLWKLGTHKILCGDSTSARDVHSLLGAERPHLMVTDPPYGVEYDAAWRNAVMREDGTKVGARAVGKVENDDKVDWTEAWKLFPGAVCYVWHAGIHTAEVARTLEAAGFQIRSQIIWAKNHIAIGRGDYHWQHEPCWYAVRKGETGRWAGDRKQTTLWEIDKPQKSETGHSTQKPLECMARGIRNNSLVGDLVFEPFSGSGTTIMACENLGRSARAIEISPGYVAVALQRFKDATGQTATLVE